MERSVVEKCWRRVLENGVVKRFCREVLQRGVVEKCRTRVLETSVVEKCWSSQHRQKMPTSAQLFDYDRSISIQCVNLRVRGFHLCFA